MELPKYNKSNKTGREGLNLLATIVESELGWMVRPTHQEDDFGIDAYIDVIIDGYVTGKSIAIQVKAGKSYLKEITPDLWSFVGERKHLNYYLNQDISVLIIIVDLNNKVAYWEACEIGNILLNGESWSMPVPKKQQINSFQKDKLLKYTSKTVDYVAQLEQYWNENKILSEFNKICIFVGKEDIEQMNYQPLIDLKNRICSNKLLLSRYKTNIEIGIHGYDSDKRELYQIAEVRDWIANVFNNVSGLTYFLTNDKNAIFLKLFILSIIQFQISNKLHKSKKIYIKYESKDLKNVFNILYSDLNSFTEAFEIDEEVNEQISNAIANCIIGNEFP